MSDNKNGGWLIGAGALIGAAVAGKKAYDKHSEKKAAEARKRAEQEKKERERQQYENSFAGKAENFIFNGGLTNFVLGLVDSANAQQADIQERYERAQKDMKYKSNTELKRIAEGNDAVKRRAAMEELRRRGY